MANRTKVLDLECIEDLSGIKGATPIIVLHGYGADCNDLYPIKRMIENHDQFDWYFFNGPIEVPIFPMMNGRAWFDFRFQEYQQALMSGQATKFFSEIIPEGLEDAVTGIKASMKELKSQRGYDQFILGGFSQGSMVSAFLTAKNPELVKKLYLLSSTLLSKDTFLESLSKIKQIPIYQTHGKQDPVLPYAGAVELKEILSQVDDYEFYDFNGGHELPLDVLTKLSEFLNR